MGKFFSIEELSRSTVAMRRGIDNTPGAGAIENMETLITELLDPVRQIWGGPLIVNSGYRSAELNKAIGGAPRSQHLEGEAADITAGSRKNNRKLFGLIFSSGLDYDQLIDENDYSWLHVSYSSDNRRQTLHLK